MKKAISSILTLTALMAVLVACGKSGGDGGGANPAGPAAATPGGTWAGTPPQNCNIPGNTGCAPSDPTYYQNYAPNFLPYQWGQAQNGFCGCPAGTRPVMNTQWGVSCAPDNWFPNGGYYYGYSYQSVMYYGQNTQYSSIPQITYSPAISGYATGNTACYSQAAQVCDTRVANSCAQGSSCRQTSGGSYLGLCSNGVGHDNYSNPYQQNCWRYSNYYGWMNTCYSHGGGYYGGGGGYFGGGFYGGGYGGGGYQGGHGTIPR